MTHIKKYRWEDFTGVLPFRMTSDYLFKYLLQSDSAVLKAIICAYLDIKPEDIRSIRVTNTISLSDDPAKKEMILPCAAGGDDAGNRDGRDLENDRNFPSPSHHTSPCLHSGGSEEFSQRKWGTARGGLQSDCKKTSVLSEAFPRRA